MREPSDDIETIARDYHTAYMQPKVNRVQKHIDSTLLPLNPLEVTAAKLFLQDWFVKSLTYPLVINRLKDQLKIPRDTSLSRFVKAPIFSEPKSEIIKKFWRVGIHCLHGTLYTGLQFLLFRTFLVAGSHNNQKTVKHPDFKTLLYATVFSSTITELITFPFLRFRNFLFMHTPSRPVLQFVFHIKNLKKLYKGMGLSLMLLMPHTSISAMILLYMNSEDTSNIRFSVFLSTLIAGLVLYPLDNVLKIYMNSRTVSNRKNFRALVAHELTRRPRVMFRGAHFFVMSSIANNVLMAQKFKLFHFNKYNMF